jgi:hypothetical protein
MQSNRCLLALLMLVFTAILTACGSLMEGQLTPATGGVPVQLLSIQGRAKDSMDNAMVYGWVKVDMNVRSIDQAWQAYQPQASTDQVPQSLRDAFSQAFTRLQEASTAKDIGRMMQAANDLNAAVVELIALYHPPTPIDLDRLDVLERQVVLDAQAGDFTAVEASLAKINAAWQNLKPSLPAKGADLAAQFESGLLEQSNASNAKNATALADEAIHCLEFINGMRTLY